MGVSGVSKKSVSWTSTFVTTMLQEHGRRSHVTFLAQTFWTPPSNLMKARKKDETLREVKEEEKETNRG